MMIKKGFHRIKSLQRGNKNKNSIEASHSLRRGARALSLGAAWNFSEDNYGLVQICYPPLVPADKISKMCQEKLKQSNWPCQSAGFSMD